MWATTIQGLLMVAAGGVVGFLAARSNTRRDVRREAYFRALEAAYDWNQVVQTNIPYWVDIRDGVQPKNLPRAPVGVVEHDERKRAFILQYWTLEATTSERIATRFLELHLVLEKYADAARTRNDQGDADLPAAELLDQLVNEFNAAITEFVGHIKADMKLARHGES